MRPYSPIDTLEIEVRAGRGAAVIVEGETYGDDPWFYGEWFNDRASQVTFFPQNGWPRVVTAVAELRLRCPDISIYGIIDRDLASDDELDSRFEREGILLTPRYTLENYLLDPVGWAQVFALIFRRYRGAPDGWDDPEQVQIHIAQSYQACLRLAACNWVIGSIYKQYPVQAEKTPMKYLTHPDASKDSVRKLKDWREQLGIPDDLETLFEQRNAELLHSDLADWQKYVSGKYVLEHLHLQFPLLPPSKVRFPLSHYQLLYLDKCPTPPDDLAALIERIIAHAAKPPP